MSFQPALKTLKCDDRGRINIGSVDPQAKGREYTASLDRDGRVLLTPIDGEFDNLSLLAVERG